MSNLPAEVQIGPYRYAVVMDGMLMDEAGCTGQIRYEEQRIVLNPKVRGARLPETLLHEIIHGCLEMSQPERHDPKAEGYVARLAPLLLDTLRRNPALVAFLVAADA